MEIRDRLVAVAQRRFAADGLLAVRLQDIREEAGVSVGAVYHHFPDKAHLYVEAWLAALADYQADFVAVLHEHAVAEDGVRAVVSHHLAWVQRHRDRAVLLSATRPAQAEDAVRTLNRSFFADVSAWWRPHVHYGAVRDLPTDLTYALWLGAAQEYCRLWMSGRARRIPSDVASALGEAAWLALTGEDQR